jgi:drug/metabolite transporter (DMT)-like permease
MAGGAAPGIAFGLGSAASFGVGDFAGGLAARRASGLAVAAAAQAVGWALLLVVLAIARPALPDAGSLLAGLAAGIAGAVGVAALYRGLSMGSMGIVAALSGAGAIVVPLIASLLGGAAISVPQVAGVACIGAAAAAGSGATMEGVSSRALVLAGVAALGFGLWYVLLARAATGDALWALVASRASGALFIGAVATLRGALRGLGSVRPLILVSGVCDVGGNALYVAAGTLLPVGLAAALSGIYPLVTMGAARLILRERLPPLGLIGVAFAVAGILLISLG